MSSFLIFQFDVAHRPLRSYPYERYCRLLRTESLPARLISLVFQQRFLVVHNVYTYNIVERRKYLFNRLGADRFSSRRVPVGTTRIIYAHVWKSSRVVATEMSGDAHSV